MTTVKPLQASFAAGEITGELLSRTDLVKFQSGLRYTENVLIKPQGGIINRPGTKFVSEVKDSTALGRVVPFSFNSEQTYMLLFGDQTMRVFKDGAAVLEALVTVSAITQANPGVITATAHGYSDGDEIYFSSLVGMDELGLGAMIVRNSTTNTFEVSYKGSTASVDTTSFTAFISGSVGKVYEINTIYTAAELAELKWIQSADVVYFTHPDRQVRKLARTADNAWTLTALTFDPSLSPPTGIAVTPSTLRSNVVTPALTSWTATNTTVATDVAASPYGDQSYKLTADSTNAEHEIVISAGDITSEDADEYMSFRFQVNANGGNLSAVRVDIEAVSGSRAGLFFALDGTADEVFKPSGGATPGDVKSFSADALTGSFAGWIDCEVVLRASTTNELAKEASIRLIDASGNSTFVGDSDDQCLVAGVDISQGLENGESQRYVVTAIASDTGEESEASLIVRAFNDLSLANSNNQITWESATGAVSYVIYKDDNGVFGFVGDTSHRRFTDNNITPDVTEAPPTITNPFENTDDRPSTSSFFEQRLVFAASNNKPQTLWFSRSGSFENFGSSTPIRADDGFDATLVARQVNAIKHLIAREDLWALTSGGEWQIRGNDNEGVLTPSSITTRKVSSWGSGDVQPLEIGTSVLFVVSKGQGVRDLFNKINFTEFDAQDGSDLSILAPHLFEGRTVTAWAYAQAPYSAIWVVLSDGALLSFTFYREHQVYAWCRHSEGQSAASGNYEDVAVIQEGDQDVPYFLVRRTINGETKRYLERMPKRASAEGPKNHYFVDCGATYDGTAATVIKGLRHLEARDVVALADGNVVTGLTVSDGQVTLPFEAEKVHVGLGYSSKVRTLPLELNLQTGTTVGRPKGTIRAHLRIRKTRGVQVGTTETDLEELPERERELWGEPTDLETGVVEYDVTGDWGDDLDLWLVQENPLPMEVLSITPEFGIGR